MGRYHYFENRYDIDIIAPSVIELLVQLQLQRNRLTTINACSFDNALAVEEIWLTANPIHCDCAVAWTSPAATNQSTSVCNLYPVSIDQRPDRLVAGWVTVLVRKA